MTIRFSHSLLRSAALLLALALAGAAAAQADDSDPPTRVARLAYMEGTVSLQPGGTDQWVDAPVNRPLTTGDSVWSDADSRAELQLDGSLLRLSSRTSMSFLNVADHVTQIQLSSGTMIVRVRRLDNDETYEIDTPNLALSLLAPGLYRVSVADSGTATTIAVRSGQGEVTGGGTDLPVTSGQQVVFTGTDTLNASARPYAADASAFDAWSANRDVRWDHSVSASYVSSDVVGYTDLDDQGDWNSTPDYGYVWFPRRLQPGWAPYHFGHWAYIAPWGYTWVDDRPWGFAPFHYGRWISVNGSWGWVPCPPRPRRGEGYVRPVYAPALVAWIGAGAGVAWFALGPREVYMPSYPVSRAYVNNINVSNTIVNRTVVNNIYNNTTISHNRTRNGAKITYVNRGVRGAITATTTQAFTSAQPVASHAVQFNPRAGRVEPFAPSAVPTRQAVLGMGRQGPRPPTALETRAVVARTTPPPPPPSFERRQQAIQQNGGRPLSQAAVRQIQPQIAQRTTPIRIAPPTAQRNSRPGSGFSVRRNGPPQAAPAAANPVAPPQHLQNQLQLQERQQAEQSRQRQVQTQRQDQAQQQEQVRRQQLGQQQQDQGRRQQLQQQQEQARRQQVDQQAQQQRQQQEQQRQQQQQQRQQQEQQEQVRRKQLEQQAQQQRQQQEQQQQRQQQEQQRQQQQQQRQQQEQQEQVRRQQLEQQAQQQAQQQRQQQGQQRQQQLQQQLQQQQQQQQRAQEELQRHQQQQQQQPKPAQETPARPPVRHEDKPNKANDPQNSNR